MIISVIGNVSVGNDPDITLDNKTDLELCDLALQGCNQVVKIQYNIIADQKIVINEQDNVINNYRDRLDDANFYKKYWPYMTILGILVGGYAGYKLRR